MQLGNLLLLQRQILPISWNELFADRYIQRHLLCALLGLLRVDKLELLDVVAQPVDLELVSLFSLRDGFFLVNDLQVQLPSTNQNESELQHNSLNLHPAPVRLRCCSRA